MPENLIPTPSPGAAEALRAIDALPGRFSALTRRIRGAIVGQHDTVEHLLIAAFCQGHVLIQGVPGLAKTLLVRTLASALALDFKRIQFTPDLMPGDILGAELLRTDPITGERALQFVPGPVFANIVLADEINRTPPRTQAALLEAMAERQVSVGGVSRRLAAPFIVVATQNPIEQEGTYPLPEAQLDRFMFGLRMEYPKLAEERLIAGRPEFHGADRQDDAPPVFTAAELAAVRPLLDRVPLSEHTLDHAVALARATRPGDESAPKWVGRYVAWGAGPRATQMLLVAARCRALLHGRPTPLIEDVRSLAPAVLRHRLVLNYAAASEDVSADRVVDAVLEHVAPL